MTWTAGIGVGLAALFIQRQPPPLADPAGCPGLLEFSGAIAARLAPAVPLASILRIANTVAAVVGLAAAVRIFARGTRSIVMGASVGIAVAAMPAFAPELAPSGWLAVAAAAAALTAVGRAARDTRPAGSATATRAATILALAATAAIAPPLTLPLFAVACWCVWTTFRGESAGARATWIAATAGAFGLAILLCTALMPALPSLAVGGEAHASCLIPSARAFSTANVSRAIATVFAGVGPLPIGLAALGVFSLRARIADPAAWPLVAAVAAPLLAVSWSAAATPVRTLAPLVLGFWWLVAAGLREFASSIGRGVAPRLAIAALVAGVPLLQLASLRDPAVPRPAPFGHEALSERSFTRLLGTLADQSALVEEDAVVDLLERAAAATPSAVAKRISTVPELAADLAAALASHRVFALPRAQLDLQQQGFKLQDAADVFARGVAEVRAGGACGPIGAGWADLPGLAASDRLALVADGPADRGPIIVYLGSETPLRPAPLEWPGLSRRGFFESHYDTTREADRRQLDADLAIDSGPIGHPAVRAAVVTRLELWRVPGAPLSLVVELDHAPAAAVARTLRATAGSGIRVCPTFEHAVVRLQIPLR